MSSWVWAGFNAFILALLAIDLYFFHCDSKEVTMKESLGWSFFWFLISLIFGAGIFLFMGQQAGLEYLTGYTIEKSLSVDNLFVFVILFQTFSIPPKYQYRILFWGILGALIMRFLMIAGGVILVEKFHWVLYVFAVFLLVTGMRTLLSKDEIMQPKKHWLYKLISSFIRSTPEIHGKQFFVKIDGRRYITPLFMVLIMVEFTDLIFALDSIPAIFAITRDPFIIYTSNVFAILGLRALYFLLANIVHKFIYLKVGLSIILIYVGCKMIGADFYQIHAGISLLIILSILSLSIGLSILRNRKELAGNRVRSS